MRDQVAIVTGAAAGIGKGIAEVLLQEGCKVTIVDWDENMGMRTAQELTPDQERVQFIRADVSSEVDIQRSVDLTLGKWGKIDILINNVGTHYHNPVEKITAEDWDRVLGTDLRGHFLFIQKVLPLMKSSGKGAVVNIASVHAWQTLPHFSAYAAVKGGVISMSRSIALECAPHGIRINTVLPGMTRNGNVERHLATLSLQERDGAEREMARNIPIGRIADAREIGHAVAFLASDRASFITGTTLIVDGGESSHLSWQR